MPHDSPAMSDLPDAELRRLMELEEKATPPNWVVSSSRVNHRIKRDNGDYVAEPTAGICRYEVDADFIALARNLCRQICERALKCSELESQLAEANAKNDELRRAINDAALSCGPGHKPSTVIGNSVASLVNEISVGDEEVRQLRASLAAALQRAEAAEREVERLRGLVRDYSEAFSEDECWTTETHELLECNVRFETVVNLGRRAAEVLGD